MKLKLILSAIFFNLTFAVSYSQFDDLYYDPYKDASKNIEDDDIENNVASNYDNESYGYSEEYDDAEVYDDYDGYEYATRVRRFCRPSNSFSYYSPIWGYTYQNNYYDPFYDSYWYGGNNWYGSNNTILIVYGNPYYSWNRWNRWNSWNSWNYWNGNSYCGFNNWGYDGWGYNRWGYGGWHNNHWGNGWSHNGWNNHNNGWGNGNNNNNNNNNSNGSYYGSRKSGSSIASTKGRKEGPRKDVETPTIIRENDLSPAPINENNPASNSTATAKRTPTVPKRTDHNDEMEKTGISESDRSSSNTIYKRKRSDYSSEPSRGNGNSNADHGSQHKRSSVGMDRNSSDNNSSSQPKTERRRESPPPSSSPRYESKSYERSSSSSHSGSSSSSRGGGSSASPSRNSDGGGGSSSSPRSGGGSGSSRRGGGSPQ